MWMKNRKINRICAFLSAFVIFAAALPMEGAYAKPSETEEAEQEEVKGGEEAADGNAVSENAVEIVYETIEIRTADDLIALAKNCHVDSWSENKRVVLKEDISLSEIEFEMIPYFSGRFEGNGRTISGFHYNDNGYAAGLFRYIGEKGIVEDLNLEAVVEADAEKSCIGGICGENSGIIRGCTFTGTVDGEAEIGGIAGINTAAGSIVDCSVNGYLSGYYYTGGIAGKNHGSILRCENRAGINNDTLWVEQEDESSFDWIKNLTGEEEATQIRSGVDTGGIAGYSDGTITSCTNYGAIGYEHTGYNIGGIVGRQAGLTALCKNSGNVYGRKDIGGIVGQMEPYIKIEEADSVEAEVQKLHDLINKMLDDVDVTRGALHNQYQVLKGYSDQALNTSHSVVNQISDFVDDNVNAVNLVSERLRHVMDDLPEVLDAAQDASDGMEAVNKDLQKLNEDLSVIDKMKDTPYNPADYGRLMLISGIGGTIQADNSDPAGGVMVKLTAKPEAGYALAGIQAKDAAGNEIPLAQSGGSYSFMMPSANVIVSASFSYEGAYLPASTAGGTISVDEGDLQVTVTANAKEGYELTGLTAGGSPVDISAINDKNEIIFNRADYSAAGKPVVVKGTFAKKADSQSISADDIFDGSQGKHTITVLPSTGGVTVADASGAEAGSTVHVAVSCGDNYRFCGLEVTAAGQKINCTAETEGSTYSFVMPDSNVEIAAAYEPVRFYMTSNAGGSGTYKTDGNKLVFTVNPASGYAVEPAPVVTDKAGRVIPVSKIKADSYVYEVLLTAELEPVHAQITFAGQRQYDSIQSAASSLNSSITELSASMERCQTLVEEIREIVLKSDKTLVSWDDISDSDKDKLFQDILELAKEISNAGSAAANIVSALTVISNISGDYLEGTSEAMHADIDTMLKDVQKIIDALKMAESASDGIINYLNAQQNIKFSKLGDEFDRSVDSLYTQLNGIARSMDQMEKQLDHYSGVLSADFRAVNDQLNIVLMLFIDKMEELKNPSLENVYEDVSDEDIDNTTVGRVDQCTNHAVVSGDINVGGIAGAMSIDEEDPEDNAAGSAGISLGSTYLTKCILSRCKNYGYITGKRDGVGCVAGYMNLGVASECEAYGGAESTEGEYVGGICGQSMGIIRKSYALCSIGGAAYVGGIAGYADAVYDCYAMVDAEADAGRVGAIAGQTGMEKNEDVQDQSDHARGNYYVGDELYGIDNISYVGVAEPITYQKLLEVAGLPNDYRHLKVTYVVEDEMIGSEEVAYGESLEKLELPRIAPREGENGVWPDVSGQKMKGNLLLIAEYHDNVTVLESEEKNTVKKEEETAEKPYAMAEGTYTDAALLHVRTSKTAAPDSISGGARYEVYDLTLENTDVGEDDKVQIRLLNNLGDDVWLWSYEDGKWSKVKAKVRGQYLQTTMTGASGTFCIAQNTSTSKTVIIAAGCCAAAILLMFIFVRLLRQKKRAKQKVK